MALPLTENPQVAVKFRPVRLLPAMAGERWLGVKVHPALLGVRV
jgi:hypothetical protein